MGEFKHSKSKIKLKHPINFGREKKSADIVIFDKDRPTVEYIIVEVKKPSEKMGKEQLKSYCNATGCPIGIWTNGNQILKYSREDPPNYFEELTNLPNNEQKLSDILGGKYTLKNLIIKDKIPNEGKL
jgi:type I restriction enzyme M protein